MWGDQGFTLVELVIALLVIAIVMAAIGPAIYGVLKASADTNQRSVADNLAVQATEQMRSYAYSEIGYTSTQYGAISVASEQCNAGTQVTVGSTYLPGPVTTTSMSNVSYTISRCVYWVSSSAGDTTNDYKQIVVSVSWASGGQPLTFKSAVYPSGADISSTTTTTTVEAASPSPPTNVAAQDDSTYPTQYIDVLWSPPSTSADPVAGYDVEYSTTYSGSGYLTSGITTKYVPGATACGGTTSCGYQLTAAAGQTYYVEVYSVDASGVTSTSPGTSSSGNYVVSASTTTGTTGGCQVTGASVTPSTASIDKNGYLETSNNQFSLSVTTNGDPACTNDTITMQYTPSGSGTPTTSNLSGSGTLTGTAGSCSTVWTAGNHTFSVYLNNQLVGNYVPTVNLTADNSNKVHC